MPGKEVTGEKTSNREVWKDIAGCRGNRSNEIPNTWQRATEGSGGVFRH